MATAFKYCGPCIFFTNEVCQKREKSSHHYLMQLVAVIKWIRQLHYVLSYWIKLWPNLGRWSWRLIIKWGMHRYTNHSVLHNSNIFYPLVIDKISTISTGSSLLTEFRISHPQHFSKSVWQLKQGINRIYQPISTNNTFKLSSINVSIDTISWFFYVPWCQYPYSNNLNKDEEDDVDCYSWPVTPTIRRKISMSRSKPCNVCMWDHTATSHIPLPSRLKPPVKIDHVVPIDDREAGVMWSVAGDL